MEPIFAFLYEWNVFHAAPPPDHPPFSNCEIGPSAIQCNVEVVMVESEFENSQPGAQLAMLGMLPGAVLCVATGQTSKLSTLCPIQADSATSARGG